MIPILQAEVILSLDYMKEISRRLSCNGILKLCGNMRIFLCALLHSQHDAAEVGHQGSDLCTGGGALRIEDAAVLAVDDSGLRTDIHGLACPIADIGCVAEGDVALGCCQIEVFVFCVIDDHDAHLLAGNLIVRSKGGRGGSVYHTVLRSPRDRGTVPGGKRRIVKRRAGIRAQVDAVKVGKELHEHRAGHGHIR